MTKKTKEIVSNLIRNKFDALKYWQEDDSRDLIASANDLGLNDLAKNMIDDY